MKLNTTVAGNRKGKFKYVTLNVIISKAKSLSITNCGLWFNYKNQMVTIKLVLSLMKTAGRELKRGKGKSLDVDQLRYLLRNR